MPPFIKGLLNLDFGQLDICCGQCFHCLVCGHGKEDLPDGDLLSPDTSNPNVKRCPLEMPESWLRPASAFYIHKEKQDESLQGWSGGRNSHPLQDIFHLLSPPYLKDHLGSRGESGLHLLFTVLAVQLVAVTGARLHSSAISFYQFPQLFMLSALHRILCRVGISSLHDE